MHLECTFFRQLMVVIAFIGMGITPLNIHAGELEGSYCAPCSMKTDSNISGLPEISNIIMNSDVSLSRENPALFENQNNVTADTTKGLVIKSTGLPEISNIIGINVKTNRAE